MIRNATDARHLLFGGGARAGAEIITFAQVCLLDCIEQLTSDGPVDKWINPCKPRAHIGFGRSFLSGTRRIRIGQPIRRNFTQLVTV